MDVKEKIVGHVESEEKEIVSFLQELVKIPTPTPPGENYDKIAELVAEKCRSFDWETHLCEAPEKYLDMTGREAYGLLGPRVNVVSTIKGSKDRPTLVYNAHTDMVPVGPGWSVEPYSATIKDNVIYGRGASDDKAGVAAMIYAMETLQEMGIKLPGRTVLTATVDEEIGGFAGLNYLIAEGIVGGDYGISLDGSITNVTVALNGRLRWRIHAYGRSVHSSIAFRGVNAIEKMAKIVLAIQAHGKALQEKYTKIPAPPEVGKPFIYPIASVGVIQGGVKDNIVPDRCTIAIDRRVTPEETLDSARGEFRSVVEAVQREDQEFKYEIEEVSVREPCYTPIDHPLALTMKKISSEILGEETTICGSPGSSDVSFMVNQGKIPTVSLGPGRLENNVHGVDEHLSIKDLLALTKIHAIAAVELTHA